jgi:hypothetical protein
MVSSSVEVEEFDTTAQVVTRDSAITTSNDTCDIKEQPEDCPNELDDDTPICADCGGATYFFHEEFGYHDARCKGVCLLLQCIIFISLIVHRLEFAAVLR